MKTLIPPTPPNNDAPLLLMALITGVAFIGYALIYFLLLKS